MTVTAQDVLVSAVALCTPLDRNELWYSALRSTGLTVARHAITGALRELSHPVPSWTEIASLTGCPHHTTAMDRYRRWKDWPSGLRTAWLSAVRQQLEKNP